jgi:hypothetical protein
MGKVLATATLLLPASDRCLQFLPRPLVTVLARADRLDEAAPGRQAQLQRHFELMPRAWPVAALTRQSDVGDSAHAAWLRADPAWVRPDINGARMLACGEALHPTQEDVDALLPALRPMFGDVGFALDAPAPARWYLRLPLGSPVPAFADPVDVVGADLFDHLPDDAQVDESTARRWRALMSDVQVVLHNHPWNAQRAAAGKPPINSLWFWGGGVMPDIASSAHAQAWSDEPQLRALIVLAGGRVSPLPESFTPPRSDLLVDLHGIAPAAVHDHWLAPAIDAMRHRRLADLHLDCSDGVRLRITAAQHWRFWRKPQSFVRRALRDE